MKIQEVAGAELWAELRKQIDLIKPKQKTAKKAVKPKKAKSSDLARATAKVTSDVARLKPQSPIKPVVLARPSKAR
jgi:hypothetical protein